MKAEGKGSQSERRNMGKGSGPKGDFKQVLEVGGFIGTEVREETALMRAHWRALCSCLEPTIDEHMFSEVCKNSKE
jgi:hypothetical protein